MPVVANDGASLARPQSTARSSPGSATRRVAIHDGADVVLTDPHFVRARAPAQAPSCRRACRSRRSPPTRSRWSRTRHYDHLDSWHGRGRCRRRVGWYVPLGMGEFFRERGRSDVTELDWWQSAKRGRWTITCLPSQHWSRAHAAETRTRRSGARGCSTRASTATSSRATPATSRASRQFGREFGPIDVAILPIGAYEPRWFMQYQHMDPARGLPGVPRSGRARHARADALGHVRPDRRAARRAAASSSARAVQAAGGDRVARARAARSASAGTFRRRTDDGCSRERAAAGARSTRCSWTRAAR